MLNCSVSDKIVIIVLHKPVVYYCFGAVKPNSGSRLQSLKLQLLKKLLFRVKTINLAFELSLVEKSII